MKPAKILAFALALLAGGIPAAQAGDCAIAFGHAADGVHYGAAGSPSGQVFTWVGTGGPVARSGTAVTWRCRPGVAAGAPLLVHGARHGHPHRAAHHVLWSAWWFWWGHPGWERREKRHRHGHWHGPRHDRRWHGKPPRRAKAHGWHRHRGWHREPRHTRRHYGHDRHDRRERGHRPRRRH